MYVPWARPCRRIYTRPSLVSSFFFRLGAGLKAAVPVMSRPDTSTLTSYVPSYLDTACVLN